MLFFSFAPMAYHIHELFQFFWHEGSTWLLKRKRSCPQSHVSYKKWVVLFSLRCALRMASFLLWPSAADHCRLTGCQLLNYSSDLDVKQVLWLLGVFLKTCRNCYLAGKKRIFLHIGNSMLPFLSLWMISHTVYLSFLSNLQDKS